MLQLTEEAWAEIERDAISTPDKRRSLVFSILKCEFGWDGDLPASLSADLVETRIQDVVERSDCDMRQVYLLAGRIALGLEAHGVRWRPRADGQPNTLQIVDGLRIVRHKEA